MTTITKDDLENSPDASRFTRCPRCQRNHKILTGPIGYRTTGEHLFVRCQGVPCLVGFRGKVLTHLLESLDASDCTFLLDSEGELEDGLKD